LKVCGYVKNVLRVGENRKVKYALDVVQLMYFHYDMPMTKIHSKSGDFSRCNCEHSQICIIERGLLELLRIWKLNYSIYLGDIKIEFECADQLDPVAE
jgi:hypothetical protein